MGKKSSKKKAKTEKPKEGKKDLKTRVAALEKGLAALEEKVSDQLEQLSQRNAALLRKVGTNEK